MGISHIRTYKDHIQRDFSICGSYSVYMDVGQDCGTIYYLSVPIARKVLELDENAPLTGRELADCTKCACHYSYGTKEYNQYSLHLCKEAKEKYAKSFE